MEHLKIPKNYHSALNLHDTQIAIKTVKDFFQNQIAQRLNLARVSAPLFVDPLSGLNDNLNGVERPVSFDIKEQDGRIAEVVQSLAKWKRYALQKYGFSIGEGIYTDMNAIRRDEDTDNIHSILLTSGIGKKLLPARIEILTRSEQLFARCINVCKIQRSIWQFSMIILKKSYPMKSILSPRRNWQKSFPTTHQRSVSTT